jgi:hypothetical protein
MRRAVCEHDRGTRGYHIKTRPTVTCSRNETTLKDLYVSNDRGEEFSHQVPLFLIYSGAVVFVVRPD